MSRELTKDPFLGSDPDCPVFGFNLACAFPFPASAVVAYRALAEKLKGLDPGLYVYPHWETHITIVTWASFSKHRRPTSDERAGLDTLLNSVLSLTGRLHWPRRFRLIAQAPQLTAKAIILPIEDPSGEIPTLRAQVRAAVDGDEALRRELEAAGWNIPGIVHSTVARFARLPPVPEEFAAAFERVAASFQPIPMSIDELVVTTETKPYMRGGEILRRFPLADNL